MVNQANILLCYEKKWWCYLIAQPWVCVIHEAGEVHHNLLTEHATPSLYRKAALSMGAGFAPLVEHSLVHSGALLGGSSGHNFFHHLFHSSATDLSTVVGRFPTVKKARLWKLSHLSCLSEY